MQKIAKKVFIVLLILLMVVSVVSIFTLTTPSAQAAGGNVWHTTTYTSGSQYAYDWDIVSDGTNLHYLYYEDDGTGNYDIWTATTDLEGNNWTATKREDAINPYCVQMTKNGGKLFFLWIDSDSGEGHIWTASMNTDGTGWTSTQRTTPASIDGAAQNAKMTNYGSKVYFSWLMFRIGFEDIYTASINNDGTGWESGIIKTYDSSTVDYPDSLDFVITNDVLYYILVSVYNSPSANRYISTATANINRTGWTEAQKSGVFNSNGLQYYIAPKIETDGVNIYYMWHQPDENDKYQIHFGSDDLAQSNWISKEVFASAYEKTSTWFAYDNNTLYYSWEELDSGGVYQIWSGTTDTSGSETRPTQRTFTSYNSQFPAFTVGASDIYYTYTEYDAGGVAHIAGAIEDNTDTAQETQTVTATVPSSLTFTIDGVVAGNPCANSGGNADITTTGTTIPFGIYTGSQSKVGCQTLTVSTNATDGYVITVEQDQDLTSSGADIINPFSGTYATPTTWASPPGTGTDAYFGYTTDDTDLSNFQTSKYGNFLANDTPYQIVYESGPVSNEANVMSYQLEVNALQEAGTYTNTLKYIATATF